MVLYYPVFIAPPQNWDNNSNSNGNNNNHNDKLSPSCEVLFQLKHKNEVDFIVDHIFTKRKSKMKNERKQKMLKSINLQITWSKTESNLVYLKFVTNVSHTYICALSFENRFQLCAVAVS